MIVRSSNSTASGRAGRVPQAIMIRSARTISWSPIAHRVGRPTNTRVTRDQADAVAAELLAHDRGLGGDDARRAVHQLAQRLALGLLQVRRGRARRADGARGARARPGAASWTGSCRCGSTTPPIRSRRSATATRCAELRGLDRSALPARAGSDDEKVELHSFAPYPAKGPCSTPCQRSCRARCPAFASAAPSPRRTSTRRCARSASRCSRRTSTSRSSSSSRRRSRSAALGVEVSKQLNPGQQVVKIVNEELTALMGGAGGRADLLAAPADRDADGRPAGLGQDDRDGQARASTCKEQNELLGGGRRLRRLPARPRSSS